TLVGFLGRQPEVGDRPLLDKTNMPGTYDFTLHWAPDRLNAGLHPVDSNNADSVPGGPSLFTALEDQLGLKLVPEKAPIQVLVIDHVEPPSPN
ncbi:MAG TPA: TIGR03435 family protein, partial [Acidobacteriaceae bacterium]|nr:TIGR03435 family protein [Acidobacteriaceae bacterium]